MPVSTVTGIERMLNSSCTSGMKPSPWIMAWFGIKAQCYDGLAIILLNAGRLRAAS